MGQVCEDLQKDLQKEKERYRELEEEHEKSLGQIRDLEKINYKLDEEKARLKEAYLAKKQQLGSLKQHIETQKQEFEHRLHETLSLKVQADSKITLFE